MAERAPEGGGLRVLLRIISVVMVVAGSATVVLGVGSLPASGDPSAIVDSEMRFYAVWYVVAGLVLWRASANVADATWFVRVVGIAFFAAGCARFVSWLVEGAPHWSQAALMVIELVIPLVMIPWQTALSRRTSVRSRTARSS